MSKANRSQPTAIRWFRRQLADLGSDLLTAHRKMAEIALSPDRQMIKPGLAPDTYAEFLFRTSGPLRHDPPAGPGPTPGPG